MMKRSLVAAIMLACAVVSAKAEPTDADSIKMRYNVGEVVVVGQRMAIKKENAPQKIEVITPEKIHLSPQKDLASVLKDQLGLDVLQYPGILSGVSIRGFRPESSKLNTKTLILINGRPAGSANLGMIDLSDVESVEVLKGPASAIYGPTAMGGVVNIITKNSKGDIGGRASFAYGSYNKINSSVSVGGSITPKLDFDAGIGINSQTKEYKMGNGNIFRKWLGGGSVTNYFSDGTAPSTESDKRGDGDTRPFTKSTKIDMDLRVGYDLTQSWRLNAYVNHSEANGVESPGDISYGTSPTRKDLSYTSSDLSLTGKISNSTSVALKGYFGTDKAMNDVIYEKGSFVNPYRSINTNLKWAGAQAQGIFAWEQHRLSVGVDYGYSESTSERFDKTGAGLKPYNQDFSIANLGVYTQANLSFLDERLLSTIGLRYDVNQFDLLKTGFMSNAANKESNAVVSPSVGVNYKVLPFLSVKATYGRGFSYADVYQLAGYSEIVDATKKTVSITAGNKDLKNLTSDSFDFGLMFKKSGWYSEVTYFHTSTKNNGIQTMETVNDATLKKYGIAYTKDASGSYLSSDGNTIAGLFTYKNSSKGTIDGLEVSLSYDFGYQTGGQYMLKPYVNVNSIFNSSEEADEYGIGKMKHRMLNIADNTIIYGLDYKENRFSAGFKGRYVGYRYDRNWSYYTSYVEVRYPQMMTLDLYAGFDATKKLNLSGYVSNVTDENYYEKRGYNLPGRMYTLKATLLF